jgi:hypothetical protein
MSPSARRLATNGSSARTIMPTKMPDTSCRHQATHCTVGKRKLGHAWNVELRGQPQCPRAERVTCVLVECAEDEMHRMRAVACLDRSEPHDWRSADANRAGADFGLVERVG